ncbi:hypothetical protein C8J56DRAFT_1139592 [Mycena floridula]|nr:hypothetical protein C8J56DRAFT_1139592 [Mycena floridula]
MSTMVLRCLSAFSVFLASDILKRTKSNEAEIALAHILKHFMLMLAGILWSPPSISSDSYSYCYKGPYNSRPNRDPGVFARITATFFATRFDVNKMLARRLSGILLDAIAISLDPIAVWFRLLFNNNSSRDRNYEFEQGQIQDTISDPCVTISCCYASLSLFFTSSALLTIQTQALSRRTEPAGREMWIVTFGGLRHKSWYHRAIYLSPINPAIRSNPGSPVPSLRGSNNPVAPSLVRRAPAERAHGLRHKGQSAYSAVELQTLTPGPRTSREGQGPSVPPSREPSPRPAIDLPRPVKVYGLRKPGLLAPSLPKSDIWDLRVPGNDVGSCCGTSNIEVNHRVFAPTDSRRYSPENSRLVNRNVVVDNAYMDRLAQEIRDQFRFHPTLNNCQSWVMKILKLMVKDGKLDQKDVDAIRKSMPHTMNRNDISRLIRKLKTSSVDKCQFM